jgi:Family of unknown function (DUF6444)
VVRNEPGGPGAGEDDTAENVRLRLNLALSRALVARLSRANAELAERLAAAEAKIAEMAKRLAAADARIAELTARLSQDSSNSSRPPSSDGYRKKPVGGPGGGRRGKRRRGRTWRRWRSPTRSWCTPPDLWRLWPVVGRGGGGRGRPPAGVRPAAAAAAGDRAPTI